MRAYNAYRPTSYPGRLTFLWAEHSGRGPYDTRSGWRELARGGFDVRPIPGSHLTMFEEPLVWSTAAALSEALTSSRARHFDGHDDEG